MPLQCNTCGGLFEPVLADGMAYFHACAPRRLLVVIRDGLTQTVDPGTERVTDVRVGERFVEQTQQRDENIVRGRDGAAVGIKAAGRGVTLITDTAAVKGA